jgi:hypothetical protein
MKISLKTWTLAGFVLGFSAVASLAAESTVYDFDGWKITVTPRSANSARVPKSTSAASMPKIVPAAAQATPKRGFVRPVSLVNDETNLPVAPVPAEIAPALKTTADPSPVGASVSTPGHSSPAVANEYSDLPIITPAPASEISTPSNPAPQVLNYRDTYYSIPFSRAEYNAWPSYRHDATMEFLFGQMRQTVIQRGTQNVYHYDNPNGYLYPQQLYYPYSLGLRIHHSR